MDSRIREALERATNALYVFAYEPKVVSDRPQSYGERMALESLKEINDLLTAEPEHPKRQIAEVFADIRREYGADFDKAFSVGEQVSENREDELRGKIGCALDVALHFKVTDTSDDTISAYHKWRENTLDFLLSSTEPKT